ncbi:hypothetical protein ACH419_39545 [Streptomyces bobili]|uniref:hypothetical protein n=1 Tax=Streptomyces bobili TaxID=67280 RepID=UPI0037898559
MNTRLVNSAAGVVLAAMEQDRTAAGIALALESAQLLMSPETAAELAGLRARLADVHRMPQDNLTPAEVRLTQYGERTKTWSTATHDSGAEKALYEIACALRDTLEETRDQRNAARLKVTGLESRVSAILAERHSTNESVDDAAKALRANRDRIAEQDAQREALTERLRAGQHWQRGRNPELVSENHVSQSELRAIFGIPLTAPWEDEAAVKCRCDEPGADQYACEADPEDCTGEFSELNPFGGAGPVEGRDAKVSRRCGRCGWDTSVWHVDDGSAEEELHGHVVRVHGGALQETGETS